MGRALSSRDIIRRLEADGWQLSRVVGSHHQFKHPRKASLITITHPRKDTPVGTARKIYRLAGWEWPDRNQS